MKLQKLRAEFEIPNLYTFINPFLSRICKSFSLSFAIIQSKFELVLFLVVKPYSKMFLKKPLKSSYNLSLYLDGQISDLLPFLNEFIVFLKHCVSLRNI